MNNYKGTVYFVSCNGVDYVVKNNHLDEFVALKRNDGVIVITGFDTSVVSFDNGLQWYKKLSST